MSGFSFMASEEENINEGREKPPEVKDREQWRLAPPFFPSLMKLYLRKKSEKLSIDDLWGFSRPTGGNTLPSISVYSRASTSIPIPLIGLHRHYHCLLSVLFQYRVSRVLSPLAIIRGRYPGSYLLYDMYPINEWLSLLVGKKQHAVVINSGISDSDSNQRCP
jgi:hypothetical protein